MRIYDKTEKPENAAGNEGVSRLDIKKIKKTGDIVDIESSLISEHKMEIFLNERQIMRLVCSKQYLPYLVLGRLICEGIIQTPDLIDSISICETGSRASVYTKENVVLTEAVDLQKSCCTQNETFVKGDISYIKFNEKKELSSEEIFGIIDIFSKDKEVHKATGGTHSCFLFEKGRLVFSCEDIGRHNAFDKAVGYLYTNNINPVDTTIFTTGRVPVDMAQKAIAAKIPVLISKAVPTAEAVAMAREYGLSLICRAWPDSFEVFS